MLKRIFIYFIIYYNINYYIFIIIFYFEVYNILVMIITVSKFRNVH